MKRYLACALAANALFCAFVTRSDSAIAKDAWIANGVILAADAPQKRTPANTLSATAPSAPALRASAPLMTASKTGPGQAGYIHYFAITAPDGERESQIGIELADERIAWSLPELGVVISRFLPSGALLVNGRSYEIEHLYGIRPYPDDESMQVLQRELPGRVARWVEAGTPYCEQDDAWNARCVSCLGFVLRVLYPGRSPEQPALPADFRSARSNAYSTEDLLLYLAGVQVDATREARMKRIEALVVPDGLREQLVRLASAPAAGTAASAKADAPRTAASKPRATGRSLAQSQKRAIARRRS